MENAFLIFLIMMCLAVGLIGLLLTAEGYKMDLMTWTLRDKPVVCIGDTVSYKYAMARSIKDWNNFTQDPKWHIAMGPKGKCNIKVAETKHLATLPDGSIVNGFALCGKENCVLTVDGSRNRTLTNMKRTAGHELGHIISLGHFPYPETVKEALKFGACQEDIMWSVGDCGSYKFSKELLTALECRHGEDGFGGVFNANCKRISWGSVATSSMTRTD